MMSNSNSIRNFARLDKKLLPDCYFSGTLKLVREQRLLWLYGLRAMHPIGIAQRIAQKLAWVAPAACEAPPWKVSMAPPAATLISVISCRMLLLISVATLY